ncbi:hypothetical protein BRADI_1g57310v3 [Brachypodium distachyon]|uniref:GRF-type domain-containing protein n=1 Tax=Brachypodium distachyon TaxID=15368 RepID=I1H3P7_BRADI|nr:hypothetical protein BRADI_1g57310v3 [Brachypodium distachyon]
MVSWSDASSSDNSLPHDYSDVCPDWIYDSHFPREDEEICCHHGLRGIRRVAIRGEQTGRRYIVCSNIIQDCGFAHWVDPEWPNPMKKRLFHLWINYELGQNCVSRMLKGERPWKRR